MWNLEGNVRHSGLFILFPCKLGTSTGLLIATEIKPTIMDKSPNGTVMQYSYCSVISGFPHKTVHPFRSFLADLTPATLYKVKTRTKFWVLASNVVCGVRGGPGPV